MSENHGDNSWKKCDSTSSVSSEHEEYNDEVSDVGFLMRNLFEKQMYTDVIFTSKKSNTSISAHRAVIAAKSTYFAELFFGEKKNKDDLLNHVEITGMDFDAFKRMLKYVYYGEILIEDVNFAVELYRGAKRFSIQPLVEYCESYIGSIELTEKNTGTLHHLSITKSVEALEKRCIEYIKENIARIISSEDFKRYSYSTVKAICELQSLNLKSEMQLLDAVVQWTNNKPPGVKQSLTKLLLPYIRFLSLTPVEFGDIMKQHPNLLTSSDGLKILLYLNDPQRTTDLPEWCNLNRQRRVFGSIPNLPKRIFTPKISKVVIPFQTASEEQVDKNELSSTLQMLCTSGCQKITSIKFQFSELRKDENIVPKINLRININKRYIFNRTIIIRAKEQKFTFPEPIKVTGNSMVKIEAYAVGVWSCKCFCFNRNVNMPENDKFMCHFFSTPASSGWYFISEVEYISLPRVRSRSSRKRRNKLKDAAAEQQSKESFLC